MKCQRERLKALEGSIFLVCIDKGKYFEYISLSGLCGKTIHLIKTKKEVVDE